MNQSNPRPITKRILSLDGGGAKGVYTLGFLSHLEKQVGKPLCEHFDLIYGTSTGSIIAALISLGTPIDEIYTLYIQHIPSVLSRWFAKRRSNALRKTVQRLIEDRCFSDLKKPTGIVATNWETKKPLIFKNFSSMAHAGASSFIPGFGSTLVEAICASSAAEPIFKAIPITMANAGGAVFPAYDGGFCANNPSLFAIVDAKQLGFELSETALFSVGVGHYPDPPVNNFHRLKMKVAKNVLSIKLLGGVLEASSNTTGILQNLLFKEVRTIRADEVFNSPDLGTDLLETDLNKLRKLFAQGTETYRQFEPQIKLLI